MTDRPQPLITTATVIAAVAALLALFVAFGVPLTVEQQTTILAIAAVIAPLLVAAFTHGKVTPLAAPRDDAGRQLVPDDTQPVPPPPL